jgi:hypothetical protein
MSKVGMGEGKRSKATIRIIDGKRKPSQADGADWALSEATENFGRGEQGGIDERAALPATVKCQSLSNVPGNLRQKTSQGGDRWLGFSTPGVKGPVPS